MIEQASLIVGDGNWAVKSDSLLGYKTIDGKYYPREMTFTRATTGTRVNAAGLVEVVPYNLLTWSQDFSNSTWQKFNSTILSTNNLAPDGTLTATRVNMPSASSSQLYNLFPTNVGTYTTSIWVRLVSGTGNFKLGFYDNLSILTNPITVTSTWQRFSVTKTVSAFIGSRGCWLYSDDLNQVIEVWGGQVVEGTQPLTYLPTTDRVDIPRIDYSTGEAALLLEPQRTNVNAKSNDFTISSGYWYDYNFNIPIANQGISPDGINNAWTLPLNSILTTEYGKTIGLTIGDKTAASIWAKGSETAFKLEIQNVTNTDILGSVTVNLNTGAIISGSGTVESYGNGWYRITTVGTSTITNGYPRSGIRNPNSACLIYGFQYEAGSYATSYIPTTAASVTRNADVCSNTNASAYIGQTEGTIFLDFILLPNNTNSSYLFSVSDGTTSNLIRSEIFVVSPTVSQFRTGITTLGVPQGDAFTNITQLNNKMAISYKLNEIKIFLNGVLVATDTSATIPTTSQVYLGSRNNSGNFIGSYYKSFMLFPTPLTNAQLAQLTTL